MKKIMLVAILAIASISVNAQKKGLQGTWFVTSQIGYQQTSTGDVKSTNLTVLPIIGTFVQPTLAVGAAIGYVGIKSENGSTTNASTGLFVVEPLVRKYYGIAGGLYFFGQLGMPIITGSESKSELKVSQFGVAASGGFDMVLGKHFTAELSYNLANFSVTTLTPKTGNATTTTDFALAHMANVEAPYNTALGGSSPTLTSPLAFGFKFLF